MGANGLENGPVENVSQMEKHEKDYLTEAEDKLIDFIGTSNIIEIRESGDHQFINTTDGYVLSVVNSSDDNKYFQIHMVEDMSGDKGMTVNVDNMRLPGSFDNLVADYQEKQKGYQNNVTTLTNFLEGDVPILGQRYEKVDGVYIAPHGVDDFSITLDDLNGTIIIELDNNLSSTIDLDSGEINTQFITDTMISLKKEAEQKKKQANLVEREYEIDLAEAEDSLNRVFS